MRASERLILLLPAVVVAVLLALFVFVLWQAHGFMLGARLFPLSVAAAGIALALAEFVNQARRLRAPVEEDPLGQLDIGVDAAEQTPAGYGRALAFFAWIVGYYLLLAVFGGPLGSALFVLVFLRARFAAGWPAAGGLALGIALLVWSLGHVLQLRWPPGLLRLAL